MPASDRKLRVFLCHVCPSGYASQDKPIVRELYQRLSAEGWIDPWLDEEKLLPGQDWRISVEESVESADIVVICISNNLDDCEVPRGLRFLQWADYFGEPKEQNYKLLIESLRVRHKQAIRREEQKARKEAKVPERRQKDDQVFKL